MEARAVGLAGGCSHARLQHVDDACCTQSLTATPNARHGISAEREQHRGIDANADRILVRPLPCSSHRITSVIRQLNTRVRRRAADHNTDIAQDLRVRVRSLRECRRHRHAPKICGE